MGRISQGQYLLWDPHHRLEASPDQVLLLEATLRLRGLGHLTEGSQQEVALLQKRSVLELQLSWGRAYSQWA